MVYYYEPSCFVKLYLSQNYHHLGWWRQVCSYKIFLVNEFEDGSCENNLFQVYFRNIWIRLFSLPIFDTRRVWTAGCRLMLIFRQQNLNLAHILLTHNLESSSKPIRNSITKLQKLRGTSREVIYCHKEGGGITRSITWQYTWNQSIDNVYMKYSLGVPHSGLEFGIPTTSVTISLLIISRGCWVLAQSHVICEVLV